jgi:hypothetical protein
MSRVAIMQPTYLPWIGYFGLINSVDIFIFLDSVQFTKRSWQQRNQIKTPNGAQWLSVPVISKGRRDQKIHEVELDPAANFIADHQKAIEHNYRKSPYFDVIAPELFSILDKPHHSLSNLNIELILKLNQLLGIKTPTLRSSEMNGDGNKADLLLSLCKEVNAGEYISPPGSREYLDESDVFIKANIPVKYFHFHHPEYSQLFGDFLPYMSVIDLLFNEGNNSSKMMIEGSQIVE